VEDTEWEQGKVLLSLAKAPSYFVIVKQETPGIAGVGGAV
jgi:hypothetical protein